MIKNLLKDNENTKFTRENSHDNTSIFMEDNYERSSKVLEALKS
jgi:hypothetical protein